MVLSLVVIAASLPALILAQAPSSSSGGPVPSGSSSTAFSFSPPLLSVNPTAVPLTQIGSNESSSTTIGLGWTTTPAAGALPTFIPGAPPLPNVNTVLPSNYPPLDKTPDITSPQVQQWIKEVQASGVVIPDIPPTVVGGCPANLAAATNTSRCWWTCGGCTRSTDITSCPDKYTWGLTYDDGPAPYTPNLLQYLDQVNLKTTFFVIGSRAISYPSILQTEYMSQHQIGVHTWSHPPLTTKTNEEIIAELGWTKKVIKDIIGVTPNIMRPPYGDIDDRVRAICIAMGLTPVIWTRLSPMATLDTGDFNIPAGTISSQQVVQNWEYIVGNVSNLNTGFIVLEHDLFQQTVQIATGYILPAALAQKNPPYSIKPVISCLNKPMQDAYIETNNNQSNPLPSVSRTPVASSGSVQATGAGTASTPSSAWRAGTSLVSCLVACMVLGVVNILI